MAGRRKARAKRRAPWWARISLVFGVILTLLSGGTLAAGAIVLHKVNTSFHQETLIASGSRKTPATHASTVKGPLDVLLAGSDLRSSWKTTGEKPRTDTIMWLHISASLDQAYLVSIPRDLVVTIPADAHTGYQGGSDRINASFPYGMKNVNDVAGGMQLLSKTVSKLTGATFDMAALINWDGFKAITAALGGVTMCLDQGFTSTQPGFPSGLTFQKGCHHYDAAKALSLVRQRYNVPGGDYGRQQLQQQFIKQILKQATSRGVVTNPAKLNAVISAAGKSFTLDLGGYSITDLALALHNITAENITTLQPPHSSLYYGGVYSGESFTQPIANQLFAAMRDDTVDQFILKHPSLVTKQPGTS